MDTDALDGIIDATLDIARRDAQLHRDMRSAILRNDIAEALRIACVIVGIEVTEAIKELDSGKGTRAR
jgi:hypothetical protein